ncbi:MAG TPA: phosphomannomutase/phosphoglucomutase [Gemmatimonadaceae bacterium]|jgi:phosphomannomutase/phosphoglucomutase|nr:phosphomannomutase/phosphoglucomutase [Gemmatimonadaceae bacterium]
MTLSKGIFREYDIRGITGKDLTPDVARLVARAYAAFLKEQQVTGTIAVGRDNRPSGEGLHEALVAGLLESGIDIVDVGIVPTPLAYWAQHTLGVAGGIQITGSHNPPEYNGFKLGVGTRSIYGDDIQRIYQLATAGQFQSGMGTPRDEPIIGRYIDDVAQRIGPLARPMRIVADAGNGAGAVVAQKLFDKLGVQTTCLFCESDGTFPNHHPDPTIPENLEALIAEVKKGGYDLGVAFDGDADRIGLVDHTGEIIWGDYILLLYARDVLARTGKGQSIIFDVKCSQALPDAVEKAGGVPVMWKTGHSLIEEKMHETHAPIAGEMSGHMFFSEGWYGFDDALYGAARVLRIVASSRGSLRDLLADVPRYVSTPELRIDCPDDTKFGIVAKAVQHFGSKYTTIDVDGVRIIYPDGWGLLRASNTQPAIVMRCEAKTQADLNTIRTEIDEWLTQQGVRV